MDNNEMVVWKRKFGYSFLIIVLVASIIGSNMYFSMLKECNASSSVSGESGENSSGDLSINSGENISLINSGESNFSEIDLKSGDNKYLNSGENKPNNIASPSGDKKGNIDFYSSNRVLDPDKPMVALTFDDGPDPKRTEKIIEIFKENNSLGTFFDVGNLMEKYPEIVKKEVEAGFDVGGHTYSHVNLNTLSQEEVKEEIIKVENAFKNATGKELKYIRPTYGNANKNAREVIDRPIINWCVDALDWKSRDADKVIEEIRKTKNLDGKIILMHSIYDSTVEAVRRLVPELVEEGYQLVTISELAQYKGYTLENGKIYYEF